MGKFKDKSRIIEAKPMKYVDVNKRKIWKIKKELLKIEVKLTSKYCSLTSSNGINYLVCYPKRFRLPHRSTTARTYIQLRTDLSRRESKGNLRTDENP